MTAAATRWPPKYRCSTRGLLAVLPLERVEHDPRFDPHAGCGLGNCWLFDARERGETVEDFADRRVAAGRVWSACPVRVSCVAWGVRNTQTGFFGGRELDNGRPVDTASAGQS